MTDIRIYVASLSDYNAGILHGAWIDCHDADQIQAEVAAMLATSKQDLAEEWAIHDSEAPWKIGEYDSFDDICAMAEVVEEFGDVAIAALEHCEDDPAVLRQWCEDLFFGTGENRADIVWDWYEDTGGIPDHGLVNYIDWDSVARDWECEGASFIYHDGTTYGFHAG